MEFAHRLQRLQPELAKIHRDNVVLSLWVSVRVHVVHIL